VNSLYERENNLSQSMGKVRRGKAKNADDSSICEKENDSDSNTSDKIAE
jgi:hypothetical protein